MNRESVRNYIYLPSLGLIEAGKTPADAIERINRAEVEKEIEEKKMLRDLKKRFPNSKITKFGAIWKIDPN